MSHPKCDDATFIKLFRLHGLIGTSKALGSDVGNVNKRRRNIEAKYGIQLLSTKQAEKISHQEHPQRVHLNVRNGVVLIGSDGHYWPGPPSVAHRAFVKFCKDLKPSAVIMNGDAFDGSTISRHPPIGWEDNPTVQQEIEVVQDRLGEIEAAAFRARKIWPLGNHDARFETRLATLAPEYAKVHGMHLRDHLPNWEACWSCWINDGQVVVKHRYKGGIHATHNNTLNAGTTIVTGHLHSLKVTPFSDYNGDRWGVDTGCLADPYGRQFVDYTEDSPRNHRSGFVVLTFVDGNLMWPEVVNVIDEDHVGFRGEVIRCAASQNTPARATATNPRAVSRNRKQDRTKRSATIRSTWRARRRVSS